MQRPMMDPTFVPDIVEAKCKHVAWRQWVSRGTRWFWGWLLTNPLTVQMPGQEKRRWSIWSVVLRMVVCWAILLPLLVGGTVLLLVFKGTHPAPASLAADPSSQGVYFESTRFPSTDGTQLSGWIVPAIDARRVLDEKDRTLKLSRPAIVLVHDYGHSMQQMLPLIKPLHDEGMVVLVMGLRGANTGSLTAQTFGLNEAKDVSAAVQLLRQTAFVDRNRIAVAGVGTGANACLIAASSDSTIKAVVLAQPVKSYREAAANRISPNGKWLTWMEPVCQRVFEVLYGVDSQQLSYDRYASLLKTRPTLLFDTEDSYLLNEVGTVHRVQVFCRKHLQTDELPRLGTAR